MTPAKLDVVPAAEPPSRDATLAYLEEMLREAAEVAVGLRVPCLSYLLEMARLETKMQRAMLRKEQMRVGN